MKSYKIDAEFIIGAGIPSGPHVAILLKVIKDRYRGKRKSDILKILGDLSKNPAFYKNHKYLYEVADVLLCQNHKSTERQKLKSKQDYIVYGAEGIEDGARFQMDTAMRLPVSVAGALMPDAHQGNGLPIGGVLATRNEVIPYGVGMDIGCRMCLSVYDVAPSYINSHAYDLKNVLLEHSRFGKETHSVKHEAKVLDSTLFGEIELLSKSKDRAYHQLGSSGGGNHFVEFGIVEMSSPIDSKSLIEGKYFAILSHSGSRGLGAAIAQHYTQVAKQQCLLPDEARHLAWLDLNTEAGQEYWLAMNLAGEYASACHHDIHYRIAKVLGFESIAMIENHHNFAWQETDEHGNSMIVHRKGATPAGKGVLGIIPGSMTEPGYIVEGRGVTASLNSASHGAGRKMSRTKAKSMLSKSYVDDYIRMKGVEVIGSGLDEAPMAYKDIQEVMHQQVGLVNILGTFSPKIVRMCGDRKM